MNTAAGYPLGVVVEGIHEVHRPDKESILMEFAKRVIVMFDESVGAVTTVLRAEKSAATSFADDVNVLVRKMNCLSI